MSETYDTFEDDLHDPAWRTPRGPFALRLGIAVLLAFALGAGFTWAVPQLFDLALRLGLGVLVAIVLYLLPLNLSYSRGGRGLIALGVVLAFLAGQWGPWMVGQFGGLAGFADIEAAAAAHRYDILSFGVPMVIEDWVIVLWIGVSALMILPVAVVPLARPDETVGFIRTNPFATPRYEGEDHNLLVLILGYPLAAFGLAMASTYLDEVFGDIGVPTQLAGLLILLVALMGGAIRATFGTAILSAVLIGIAGVLGFWGPWLVQHFGVDGALSFVLDDPATLIERIRLLSGEFGYTVETSGVVSDYSDWTYPIWMAGTLALLLLPLVAVLYRRIFYFLRWN